MAEHTSEQLTGIFARQRQHQASLARTTAKERVARLQTLRAGIVARREELYQAFAADFGKPRAEVEVTEIQPTLIEIRHMCSHLAGYMKPRRVSTPLLLTGTASHIRYEPRGVVLILSPWNYPFYLLLNPLVAAVAAGNCVMLRPSEKVPRTSDAVQRLLEDSFSPEEVAVCRGGRAVADALLELPFDHVFFTGSTQVGSKVMAAAARHLASVTLELGGKSPAVVDATANVARAAERIVWGKLINAGQTCVAPDYAMVHESVLPLFLEHARAAVERLYGPSEEARAQSPDFCRVVDRASCARLEALVEDSMAAGARIVTGGVADVERRYLAPTLLADVTPGSPIMAAEIFGPVLPVLAWRTLEDVLAVTRTLGKPLALYVFSRSSATADEILRAIPAGGSCVNNVVLHLANAELPFGGIGPSGLGNYHGQFGFRTFSHERAVLVQREPALVRLFYPPYGPRVEKLLRLVNRFVT